MEIKTLTPLTKEEVSQVISIAQRRVGEGINIDPISYAILMKADMNELTRPDMENYLAQIPKNLKQIARLDGAHDFITPESTKVPSTAYLPNSPFLLDY